MVNFILRPDNSGLILASLRRVLPQFFDAPEYVRLKNLGRDLAEIPGLVCAAFARYLCRLLEMEPAEPTLANACFNLIEEWSSHSDPNVQNYVITEIFENVRLPKLGEAYFKQRLGENSRKLFEEWMEYPPEDRMTHE